MELEGELKGELADFDFEKIHRSRCCGWDAGHGRLRSSKKDEVQGRPNKNRPMEASSKRPPRRFKQVIQAPKREARDPRFESLCGNLDVDGFRKRFNFLFEEELPKEREKLQKMIKTSDPRTAEELKGHISWIDKQLTSGSAKKLDKKILTDHKKKEREAVKQGKRPFYLKKSDVREQILTKKYNDLKASGNLESFMKKRRRKNASKEHRLVPYSRSGNDVEN